MKKSQINVEIEPGLRERVKVRAAQESRSLRDVVESGLRLYLTTPLLKANGSGAAETGQAAPAAERGVAMTTTDATAYETLATGNAGGRPTKDQLQALIDQVPAQRTAGGPSVPVGEDRRDAERRRVAAQDRLRTSPEDESQVDPKVDF